MRLSDAIRLGAAVTPQAFATLRDRDGETCAMGSAYLAIGMLDRMLDTESKDGRTQLLRDADWYDLLYRTDVPCPVCSDLGKWFPVTHLNDVHKWSREKIADFVELHEPLPQSEPISDVDRIGYVGLLK